jgi:hypothetical protein
MAISSETWDFFICYKRNTAEDFAKALKELLEEHGKHSFLDSKDIPAKFRGAEEWVDAVDRAVVDCKVFILLMTAGFDISDQVKREVTLARKIPNKLFIYFRHEDLKPYLKLTLERETLDLGQQQQHVFLTASDLARKAFKILIDEESNSSLKPSLYITGYTPPVILVAQSSASVGTRVKLLGTGFKPNSEIKLIFGGIKLPFDTFHTNNRGSCKGYFTVPNVVSGTYSIILSDTVSTVSTAITITPPLSVNANNR